MYACNVDCFMGFCLHIVSKNLSEPIRSHKDLDKDSALHYHKVVKFHEALAKQLVHQAHVLDLFACALDQVSICLHFLNNSDNIYNNNNNFFYDQT